MPTSTSLRGRIPGQTRIGDIVAAQQAIPQRAFAARILGNNPLAPELRASFRAALGESAVGDMLDQLGPKWDVLHVVPISTSTDDAEEMRIDHLVIGPPGVFALTTENYPGQEVRVTGDAMTIGGQSVDDISSARRLADAAAERLSAASGRTVKVEPIIVVIDSGKLVLREQPVGVTVVTSKNILRELTRIERTLAGSEVAYISDVADRDTTWESTPTTAEDSLRVSADFAALRKQVRDAAQLRAFWRVVGFTLICALAWASTVVIVDRLMLN